MCKICSDNNVYGLLLLANIVIGTYLKDMCFVSQRKLIINRYCITKKTP